MFCIVNTLNSNVMYKKNMITYKNCSFKRVLYMWASKIFKPRPIEFWNEWNLWMQFSPLSLFDAGQL